MGARHTHSGEDLEAVYTTENRLVSLTDLDFKSIETFDKGEKEQK